jgi:hypothetical protein
MSIYRRHIFPRLCDWVMSDPRMAKLRSEVLYRPGLTGHCIQCIHQATRTLRPDGVTAPMGS